MRSIIFLCFFCTLFASEDENISSHLQLSSDTATNEELSSDIEKKRELLRLPKEPAQNEINSKPSMPEEKINRSSNKPKQPKESIKKRKRRNIAKEQVRSRMVKDAQAAEKMEQEKTVKIPAVQKKIRALSEEKRQMRKKMRQDFALEKKSPKQPIIETPNVESREATLPKEEINQNNTKEPIRTQMHEDSLLETKTSKQQIKNELQEPEKDLSVRNLLPSEEKEEIDPAKKTLRQKMKEDSQEAAKTKRPKVPEEKNNTVDMQRDGSRFQDDPAKIITEEPSANYSQMELDALETKKIKKARKERIFSETDRKEREEAFSPDYSSKERKDLQNELKQSEPVEVKSNKPALPQVTSKARIPQQMEKTSEKRRENFVKANKKAKKNSLKEMIRKQKELDAKKSEDLWLSKKAKLPAEKKKKRAISEYRKNIRGSKAKNQDLEDECKKSAE